MGLPSPPLLPQREAKQDNFPRILDPEAGVMQAPRLRTPGINQKGWVRGLGPEPRTPARVVVGGEGVDWVGLREGLEG